jgi:transposase
MAGRRCAAMDAALKAVAAGMSNKDAAAKYGVSQGHLRRTRKALDMPMLPVGNPNWKRKHDSNKQ